MRRNERIFLCDFAPAKIRIQSGSGLINLSPVRFAGASFFSEGNMTIYGFTEEGALAARNNQPPDQARRVGRQIDALLAAERPEVVRAIPTPSKLLYFSVEEGEAKQ
jgi:hypothetical protein